VVPPKYGAEKNMISEKNIEHLKEVFVDVGGSYFGSGGHTAGYKILKGEVNATFISHHDNGFTATDRYRLTAKTPIAVVKIWDHDDLGGNGRIRETGSNEIVELSQ
jgi:hypothetical protein